MLTAVQSKMRSAAQSLVWTLAKNQIDIRASQRLRYRIFAQEMGAELGSPRDQIDADFFDPHCWHLLVKDVSTGEVVASTRILTEERAHIAGGFYSHGEFDLSGLFPLSGNVIEIGRTCVHPDYRNGAAITTLWAGLADFMSVHKVDYLIGCASIGMTDGGVQLNAVMNMIRKRYLTEKTLRVTPRFEVPEITDDTVSINLPPLLKAYFRLGAKVCGEPCWDKDFKVADVFILLNVNDLNPRYRRYFMERPSRVGGFEKDAVYPMYKAG